MTNIEELQECIRQLQVLLNEPEPGMHTYMQFLIIRLTNLKKLANEILRDGPEFPE